jgi:hypothetical protein
MFEATGPIYIGYKYLMKRALGLLSQQRDTKLCMKLALGVFSVKISPDIFTVHRNFLKVGPSFFSELNIF